MLFACLAMVLGVSSTAMGAYTRVADTIIEGEVVYSPTHYLAGEVIPLGMDPYGYNYQGHLFAGSYANAYLGGLGYPPYEGDDEAYLAENPTAEGTWVWPYRDTQVVMEWNDAWLANSDADHDGLLDRHAGFTSYIGSGAWLTNRMQWGYTCKIVAAPLDAEKIDGMWVTPAGELGPVIWNEFAVIREHDPYYDYWYLSDLYNDYAGRGFGPVQ